MSALKKMVEKLDRTKQVKQLGYVTNPTELKEILSELSPMVSVVIMEDYNPVDVENEIAVSVRFEFALERDQL